ncbi:MAG: ATP-binding protein [Melioribacteraceae bacterium]
MINKELIKEIIIENENFIMQQVNRVFDRESVLLPSSDIKKASLFYGVRRSGKSFLLFNIFKRNPGKSIYIDFEDERLANLNLLDLEKIREAFFELKPELLNNKDIFFLFDEIQNIKQWEKFVRRLVEKEQINVFCAGSSSKITPNSIHTSLRGRAWSVEVMPFSFRELLKTRGIDLADKKLVYDDSKIIVKNCFDEYLKFGGFPEVIFSKNEFEKKKILKEYLNAMFFRDLVERYEIKNITLLEALWDKLFSSFSTKFSLTSFYKQFRDKFPFSKDSLFSYYKYFIESMLLYEVKTFSESVYKRLRNPAKIYLIDIGLAKKTTSLDLGKALENIVFIELKRRGYEIFYFEQKAECDFVVKKEDKFEIYQVTWELNKENETREISGLLKAAINLNLNEATIITYDHEEVMKVGNVTINIIPAWKWLIRE